MLCAASTAPPPSTDPRAETLEDVADHYVQFFKRVQANFAPGVAPPVASTDGIHFDRALQPEERDALVAYLRTL